MGSYIPGGIDNLGVNHLSSSAAYSERVLLNLTSTISETTRGKKKHIKRSRMRTEGSFQSFPRIFSCQGNHFAQ